MSHCLARYRIFAIFLTMLFTINSAQADFAAGAQAYDAGDYTTAFTEWQVAAKSGDLAAMVAIADLYRRGTGRNPNAVKAFHWYQQAAKAGDAVAQMNLGEMYLNGWGVRSNRPRAWVWFDRAASQGRSWARDQRMSLEKMMSSAQLATARKLRRIEKERN
ncbi:MAG: hypothetical protein GKS01_04900 [Alphaproteobacteria bacterium]|nr:hypothetical protein [Alphaproteobacteria bacterium]